MKSCSLQLNNTYQNLPDIFYSKLAPTPVKNPKMTIFNGALAAEMGLDVSELNADEYAPICAGNNLPQNATPIAQAYAGHQFGHFTMLGDGRAHLIGEHLNPDGKVVDIQLKGSGRTPYSRGGDGRAALGPMLREYIISEAMYALGIPTTRSLAVVTTGENVMRETTLPGAVLTRVASSHIRVGTFEFAATKQDTVLLSTLLDYTIKRHYPEIIDADNKAVELLKAVMGKQAELITHWMRVGFIHGVMNTDNMTLSGETIDYGPCAFMDQYDAQTVFSSIDQFGRYAYSNQPLIAQWNIARFAETLLPLIHPNTKKSVQIAEELVNNFITRYKRNWLCMMRTKLGLFGEQKEDEKLITDLLTWMGKYHVDFTNTFRDLSQTNKPTHEQYDNKSFNNWHTRWQSRLSQNSKPLEASIQLMKAVNPAVIPRNHKVEEALGAAMTGDLQPLHKLVSVLNLPYIESESMLSYRLPPTPNERVYQTFCGT